MRCCYLSSTLRLPDASTHPLHSCSLGTDPSPPTRTLAPQWSYWMQGRHRHSMTCRRMRSLLGGCRGRGRSSSSRASCHKCTVVSGTLGRGFACDVFSQSVIADTKRFREHSKAFIHGFMDLYCVHYTAGRGARAELARASNTAGQRGHAPNWTSHFR